MEEESEIEDIKSELKDIQQFIDFDYSHDVKELYESIEKINEDMNIWGLFEDKMIPYRYGKYFQKSIKNLEKTRYKMRVNSFKNKYDNKDDIFIPLTVNKLKDKDWKEDKILRSTTFLKNSNEFFRIGKTSNIDTQPIFYYYSLIYLFSFLMESFIEFQNPKRNHGISVHIEENTNKIYFQYRKTGFFPRIVHILTLLEYPSPFSSFFIDFDGNDQIILREQTTDISISNLNHILLNKLIEYDYESDRKKTKMNYYLSDFDFRYKTAFHIIRDFIIIFISSGIARYNPKLWREIYSGEKSDLIFNIKLSFQNISNIIRFVNKITLDVESGRFPGYHQSLHAWF